MRIVRASVWCVCDHCRLVLTQHLGHLFTVCKSKNELDTKYFGRIFEIMKLVHYIRETSRIPIKAQRNAAEPYRDAIKAEIVDKASGSQFDQALQMVRKGNGLLVHSPIIIGRGAGQRRERVQAIIDKGAAVVSCDTVLESQPRIAHNRTPDEKRKAAFKYWQNHDLPHKQVAKLAGIPYGTMRDWWHKDYPRPRREPGRPRKQ